MRGSPPVGYDEAGVTLFIEHGVEELNAAVMESGFTDTSAFRLRQCGIGARLLIPLLAAGWLPFSSLSDAPVSLNIIRSSVLQRF
jgi:hypothetical protein